MAIHGTMGAVSRVSCPDFRSHLTLSDAGHAGLTLTRTVHRTPRTVVLHPQDPSNAGAARGPTWGGHERCGDDADGPMGLRWSRWAE